MQHLANSADTPDVVIILSDEERAAPAYESDKIKRWRQTHLTAENWFKQNSATLERHYAGSVACVPSRPTLFTGQYPDVHGVTQTDGLGKTADDSRMRWMRPNEVPTLGNWMRAAGYDTHYDGKWHMTHADLFESGTHKPLATNDDLGAVDHEAVKRYLEADPLSPFGFSGWVGPEPHGASLANSGLIRDPLTAARVLGWLSQRYSQRRAGDESAMKPFVLVVSFVNPHDIVLFPAWTRNNPVEASPLDPPDVEPPPSAWEDLKTKPAAQSAYRDSYYSGYGPSRIISGAYLNNAQKYRNLYYRLHAEVDQHIEAVRCAVQGSGFETFLIRTSDHGDLLGSHGGLHQKWFTLYDEALRVPMYMARFGDKSIGPQTVSEPTSHVDVLPTILHAASVDTERLTSELKRTFSEVHQLPGVSLLDKTRAVLKEDPNPEGIYMMTRDNMLEGDTQASAIARALGRVNPVPLPLRIQLPAHVASNFEGVVARASQDTGSYQGHLIKITRCFDDPSTWTEPNKRHLSSSGPLGDKFRTKPLRDQFELYDLTVDPDEVINLFEDAMTPRAERLRQEMTARLTRLSNLKIPPRNNPWPYQAQRLARLQSKRPPRIAAVLRKGLGRLGLHPKFTEEPVRSDVLMRKRAVVVCTNHSQLDVGKPTGVFSSEMTVAYYAFVDAGLEVDIASPRGGVVPIDPVSLRPPVRCDGDDRFLADDILKSKVNDSLAIGDLEASTYDIVFLAGGWGAAYDLAQSQDLADFITAANAANKVIGGVCHGPLGLLNAKNEDGTALVAGRRITAVTDKQVRELRITSTPKHPETELRKAGALFESSTAFRDPLANHWVADGNLITGQNQNAAPKVANEMLWALVKQG